MNPRDTRKTVAALRRLCKARGIELLDVPERGKGSHQGLVFHDRETGESISITIAGTKEISPGVQRAVIARLSIIAGQIPIGRIIYELVEALFTGKH